MDSYKKKIPTDGDRNDIERELTSKFLNGELSFTEYSEQYDENYDSEEDDNDVSAEGGQPDEGPSEKKNQDKKTTRKNRTKRHLPPALMGLMGEANLCYARGDRETAEKMCYEIIRQVPTAAEPFQTLSQIYEADAEKSLQFSLIAAHLNPSDSELWMKLASVSKERGDYKQEIFCYTKAINAEPKHMPYHMARIEAMKILEEQNITIQSLNLTLQTCYMRIIRSLPADQDGKTILDIAKMVARQYHASNNLERALEAMDVAYKKCADLFTLEDLNLYLELLIAQKQFDKCLDLLITKGGVDIEAEVQTLADGDNVEEVTNIVSCNIPQSLPIDLRSKLMICLIHMKAYHLIDSLLDTILENEDVENAGDIFLDVEEALTGEGCHAAALRLLQPMVTSSPFALAGVWLKYAECLQALGQKLEAIEPLKTVIRMAPQHLDARMKLSNILKENGRFEEALIALEQDETAEVLDISLVYERCQMLKEKGDMKTYLKVGLILVGRHFYKIRNVDEIPIFRQRDTGEILRTMREARGEGAEEIDAPTFDESRNCLSLACEWELLQDLFKTAHDLGYYSTFERVAFSALGSKKFSSFKNELEFILLFACLHNGDYFHAYNVVRDFIQRSPEKPKVWNMLNLVIQRIDDIRHNKFLMRFLSRQENLDKMLSILHGNNCLMAGTYKYALKEYINCYKLERLPLTAMLCGLTLTHMACQKFTTNKHTLIIQGLAFLGYYEKLRGPDGRQEAYYNIARAYHQIGLLQLAARYYKQALEVQVDLIKENPNFDLTQEIAFNLHLIYKKDAPDMARMYLEKYIII